jgi:hypothetical protein
MVFDLFFKTKLPEELPEELEKVIKDLKKSKDKQDCLKKAYNILAFRYSAYFFSTYFYLHELFYKNINKLFGKQKRMICTNFNYLMRILLVKSGFFSDKDIKIKWTQIWFVSPHQYLNVKINEKKTLNIDTWAKTFDIEFGDYAHGLNIIKKKK